MREVLEGHFVSFSFLFLFLFSREVRRKRREEKEKERRRRKDRTICGHDAENGARRGRPEAAAADLEGV